MKLIVGLGNSGVEYALNRHNLGFMVVDELTHRHDLSWSLKKNFQAEVAIGEIAGQKVILAKPTTMMNLSGHAVSKLVHFNKLQPADVWVVHDELDLDFGLLRIRRGGGSAGNNGIKSVSEAISPNYIRWRVGVGRPSGQMDAAAFVLQNFSKDEVDHLHQIIAAVADRIEQALAHGHEVTSEQLLSE